MIRRTPDRVARTAPTSPARLASMAALALGALLAGALAVHPALAEDEGASTDSALAVYDGGAVYPHEFAVGWQGQSAEDRKAGDLLELKRAFVHRVVDRELMLREALARPFTLTPAETLAYERTRATYLQNALFDRMRREEPPITDEDLAIFTRQNRELAMIRFIGFKDLESARAWRQRIVRGVPIAVLDGAIQKGGPDAPTADEPRAVAAELVPDSLAQRIWAMRPGELSDVIVHGNEVALIHVMSFIPRTSPVRLNSPTEVEAAFAARAQERIRQKFRVQLHKELAVRYDDANMAFLLDRFEKTVPPRQTTDPKTGTPNYRLTLPMPQIAANDSTRILVRTSRGDSLSVGQYLRYWNDQPATMRPEVRELEVLAATIDRVLFADILVQKAVDMGLERDSVVVAALTRFHEAAAIDHFYLAEVWNKVDLSPKKIEAYFASKPGHYDDAESIKSRILMVETKALADSLRERLEAGESFSDLAEKFSTDGESAAQGGQIGVLPRGSNARGNVSLEDAMFRTPVGKIGGPEAVPEGYVLWVNDAHFPARKRTLKDEDALGWATRDYHIEESERILGELLTRLQKKANVRYFPERVTKDLGANPDIAVD